MLLAALGKAQLSAWVESLPQGLGEWIGERGARLSAGERQRLSLARLFLSDGQMLLLDEPTSALDALTAQKVWQALDEYSRGRSLVLATHQLIAMEQMDLILVLQHGRVVEQGSHAELAANKGYYQQIWEAFQPRTTGL
jgi:ABC-type multidrug transport system fused ATPase/permease subunit